jgi:hypothetical protein
MLRRLLDPPPPGIIEPSSRRFVTGEGGFFGWVRSVLLPWWRRKDGDAADAKPPTDRV